MTQENNEFAPAPEPELDGPFDRASSPKGFTPLPCGGSFSIPPAYNIIKNVIAEFSNPSPEAK